jgi:hypothetical protein
MINMPPYLILINDRAYPLRAPDCRAFPAFVPPAIC